MWLVSTDPSPIHNTARNMHDPETGCWLTKSSQYTDWTSGSDRFLWIHGIPGAGKTVLASFIVEDVRQMCESSSKDGWAYYYCYYGREQDESPHLLRWILNQLCRQSGYIPDEVCELYRQGTQPRTANLLVTLSSILPRFRRVHVVLDALDESLDRQLLLNMLVRISHEDAFENVRFLVLSRKERDIEETLAGIFTILSLSNCLVDEDIQVYIQSQLRSNSRFRHWPDSLLRQAEIVLVKGARGM